MYQTSFSRLRSFMLKCQSSNPAFIRNELTLILYYTFKATLINERYKKGLLKTMLNRACRLSSNWKHFINECEALKFTFSNLLYPSQLIETTVNQFITYVATDNVQSDADRNNDTTPTVMFSIIFHFFL